MSGKSVGVFYAGREGLSKKKCATLEPDMWTTPEQAHKWLDLGLAAEVHSNPWRIKLKNLSQQDMKIGKLLADLVRGQSCKPDEKLIVAAVIEERPAAMIALLIWAGVRLAAISSQQVESFRRKGISRDVLSYLVEITQELNPLPKLQCGFVDGTKGVPQVRTVEA